MIKAKLDMLVAKIDGMSLRERALIFFAAAFAVVSLIDSFFLNPLLNQQKKLSTQVIQQQEKMKEVQARLAELLQARKADESSPLRTRIVEVRQRLREGDDYLQSRRDKLVPPSQMADLLEQVLNRNSRVQLVELKTLAVTPLIDPADTQSKNAVATAKVLGQDKQVYKHGVQITLRGSYGDLLDYLTALENLPTQMFWGSAKMEVKQHPSMDITLTLYTLSLDTVWLQV